MTLENAFRELRNKWFYAKLHRNSHERVWESDEEGDRRESENKLLKEVYDKQTEMIISGMSCCIAPYCSNDMNTR
jgi:hypothetical protein